MMKEKLDLLKDKIIELSSNPEFKHHKWFIEYHLNIVEQISLELCNIYTDADRGIVVGLVWMHDYAKIIDFDNQHSQDTRNLGIDFLKELGFNDNYIETLMKHWELMESKMTVDLHEAPIEVKIISSADAASHFVGPFFSLFWYENSDKSVDELVQSNQAKLIKDWNRKMVLPEVRQAFQSRHDFLEEQFGKLPEKFL